MTQHLSRAPREGSKLPGPGQVFHNSDTTNTHNTNEHNTTITKYVSLSLSLSLFLYIYIYIYIYASYTCVYICTHIHMNKCI